MLPFVVGDRLRGRPVDVLQAAARRAARPLRHRRAGAERVAAAARARRRAPRRRQARSATEADAFWLPDTRAPTTARSTRRRRSSSTTSTSSARRLGYFHNAGYYALEGEDFDAHCSASARRPTRRFMPLFAEIVRVDRVVRRPPDELRGAGARAPGDAPRAAAGGQPGGALRRALRRPTCRALSDEGLAYYHAWAFATIRQLGAAAELAALHLTWTGDARAGRGGGGVRPGVGGLQDVHPEGRARGERQARHGHDGAVPDHGGRLAGRRGRGRGRRRGRRGKIGTA